MAYTDAQGIVTPEAVVLQFENGGVASRLFAALIDLTLQFVGLFALLIATGVVGEVGVPLPDWVLASVGYVAVFLVIVGYPVLMETFWKGRTVGKAAMGLRVVTIEGAPIRFRHAAIRGAVGLFEFYVTFGFVAVLSLLFSPRSQRLGDFAAGTIVLRERSGARMPTAVQFAVPPGAEPYAATLDTSGLTGEDYGAIRSFLLRAGTLPVPVRADLARQLAAPLAQRMRHTPPAHVHPEFFLVCVAAVYQRRSAPASSVAPAAPANVAPPPGYPPPAGYGPPPAPPGYGAPAAAAAPAPAPAPAVAPDRAASGGFAPPA